MMSIRRGFGGGNGPADEAGRGERRAYVMTLSFDEAGRDRGNQPHGSPFTMNGWYVPPASAGGAPEAGGPEVIMPPVEVRIGREDILVSADMPGIPRENIDVRVNKRYIEIIGIPPEEEPGEDGGSGFEGLYPEYRPYRQRAGGLAPGDARARLRGGVLELRLPRDLLLSGHGGSRIPVV